MASNIIAKSWSQITTVLQYSLAQALPLNCFVCGDLVGDDTPLHGICVHCQPLFPPVESACVSCGLPLPAADVQCGQCVRLPPPFVQTVAAFWYDFPVDRLVQAFKYQHRWSVLPTLQQALLLCRDRLPLAEIDMLLPVPLHPRRLRERGFNQAYEIAKLFSAETGIPLLPCGVIRHKNTVSLAQSHASRQLRQRQLSGAFMVTSAVAEKTVLVVDDVMTSGATLNALAHALKQQGAARVMNLVIARTPRTFLR